MAAQIDNSPRRRQSPRDNQCKTDSVTINCRWLAAHGNVSSGSDWDHFANYVAQSSMICTCLVTWELRAPSYLVSEDLIIRLSTCGLMSRLFTYLIFNCLDTLSSILFLLVSLTNIKWFFAQSYSIVLDEETMRELSGGGRGNGRNDWIVIIMSLGDKHVHCYFRKKVLIGTFFILGNGDK